MSDLLKECQDSMDKRIKAYEMDLSKVRTGRASITILDKVRVDYYGTPTPLRLLWYTYSFKSSSYS